MMKLLILFKKGLNIVKKPVKWQKTLYYKV